MNLSVNISAPAHHSKMISLTFWLDIVIEPVLNHFIMSSYLILYTYYLFFTCHYFKQISSKK